MVNSHNTKKIADSNYTRVSDDVSEDDVQRMSGGCPEDVQRASRGVQRGSPEEGLGMYNNAYISMSRNHNDSDLRCCCADR